MLRKVFLDRYLSRDPTVRLGLMLLGSSIMRGRRALGISQSTLARRAGLSPSTISKLENGRLEGMRLYTMARIVAALNVDIQFVDGRPDRFVEVPPQQRHRAEAVWLRAIPQDSDEPIPASAGDTTVTRSVESSGARSHPARSA